MNDSVACFEHVNRLKNRTYICICDFQVFVGTKRKKGGGVREKRSFKCQFYKRKKFFYLRIKMIVSQSRRKYRVFGSFNRKLASLKNIHG